MTNAGDRKSIREAEKAARIAERQREDVTRSLMSTTSGREFVWNILDSCQVFSSTFTAEALTSAFNEGRRSVGLQLLDTIMTACPDLYLQAQRESNERDHTAAASERRRSPNGDGGNPGREGPDEASDDTGGYDVEFEPGYDVDASRH